MVGIWLLPLKTTLTLRRLIMSGDEEQIDDEFLFVFSLNYFCTYNRHVVCIKNT